MNEVLPRVSIIILTFNGEKYIDNLLSSISVQSYPKDRMEIIVIDNASIDKTVAIVESKFPQVKCIALEKNIGFAGGNNKALNYVKNEIIVFLNQDTVCHRNWLKALINGIFRDESIGACSSNIIPVDMHTLQNINQKLPPEELYLCDLTPYGYGRYYKLQKTSFVFSKILSGCSFAIHKQTVDELGYLFDEQFWMYAEDTDLSLRIHNIGKRICVARDSVVYHLHNNDVKVKKSHISFSAQAIMNRVYAFFKNMYNIEFILFFPLLFLGGILKISELQISNLKKVLYFIPFSFFSMVCMFTALFKLPKFAVNRKLVLKSRVPNGLAILKLVLK